MLASFVRVFCHARHKDAARSEDGFPAELVGCLKGGLCGECAALLAHAVEKRRKCPLDPKPSCKHCRIHCYSREHRDRIREIMAYSGRRMILRGRLDYLWHYFF